GKRRHDDAYASGSLRHGSAAGLVVRPLSSHRDRGTRDQPLALETTARPAPASSETVDAWPASGTGVRIPGRAARVVPRRGRTARRETERDVDRPRATVEPVTCEVDLS